MLQGELKKGHLSNGTERYVMIDNFRFDVFQWEPQLSVRERDTESNSDSGNSTCAASA